MSNSVTVLYLARIEDGLNEISSFIESYANFPTLIDHVLVIVVKGKEKETECENVSSVLKKFSVTAKLIWVADEIGFDIEAYRWVIFHGFVQTKYILCLKTSSKISARNWLEKYMNLFADPSVGLVGATGSFESLQSSWNAILNAQQMFYMGQLTFTSISKWKWIIGARSKIAKLFAINAFFHGRRYLKQFKFRLLTGYHSNFNTVRERYLKVTEDTEVFGFTKDFPLFPNPHIRTSGFMMETADFQSLEFNLNGVKTDSSKFESGFNSLTRQILRKDKGVFVVGANGKGYQIEDWGNSGTFRSLGQENLLITDNRTDDYPRMSPAVRETHRVMTWGSDRPLVGVNFKNQITADSDKQYLKNNLPSISIVIPTHNGNKLILETLATILKQGYPKLNLIVFDNASTTPIAETLGEIQDDRLQIYRSEIFLSVTESWNTAIDFATADYVMLFGDDDGLAPNFSIHFAQYMETFDQPDVLYANLFQAIYPGVKGKSSKSEFKFHPVCEELENLHKPIFLDRSVRRAMVINSLGLRRDFFYNMPSFVVKRSLLDSIRKEGKVFLGPFPDYYIANILFATARSLVLIPEPFSFQGISTSSFGHSLLTGTTETGFKRLGESQEIDELRNLFAKYRLNHSNYVNEFVLTMLQVQKQVPDLCNEVDLKRYRRITIFNVIKSSISEYRSEGKKVLLLNILNALRKSGEISIKEYGFVARIGLLLMLATKFPKYFYYELQLLQHEMQIMQFNPGVTSFTQSFPKSPLEVFQAIGEIQLNRESRFRD